MSDAGGPPLESVSHIADPSAGSPSVGSSPSVLPPQDSSATINPSVPQPSAGLTPSAPDFSLLDEDVDVDMAMAVEESMIGHRGPSAAAAPAPAQGAGSSSESPAHGAAPAQPPAILHWRTHTLVHSGSKAAGPAYQAKASASHVYPADDDEELIRRTHAPVALASGQRIYNPDRSLNEAWCPRCDERFSLVQMQIHNLRGCCVFCRQRTEVVTVNTVRRSGSWMVASDSQVVWPNTWVDMWADRTTSVLRAPTLRDERIEGDVIQNLIYTSLVGDSYHFDPCCPALTHGVNRDWYVINQNLDPAVPNRLGSIDVESGRSLRPCRFCSAKFIRPSRAGR